jgi:hypothetical protein
MTAIQDLLPHNHCYGCGADNDKGIYTPKVEQCAGPEQYVYGGTIASLIDCHSVGTALSNYYLQEGRGIGEAPEIWCVTGRLTVNYLALRAIIEECGERKTIVKCRVFSGDKQTAEGEVIAIRVPDSWKG